MSKIIYLLLAFVCFSLVILVAWEVIMLVLKTFAGIVLIYLGISFYEKTKVIEKD